MDPGRGLVGAAGDLRRVHHRGLPAGGRGPLALEGSRSGCGSWSCGATPTSSTSGPTSWRTAPASSRTPGSGGGSTPWPPSGEDGSRAQVRDRPLRLLVLGGLPARHLRRRGAALPPGLPRHGVHPAGRRLSAAQAPAARREPVRRARPAPVEPAGAGGGPGCRRGRHGAKPAAGLSALELQRSFAIRTRPDGSVDTEGPDGPTTSRRGGRGRPTTTTGGRSRSTRSRIASRAAPERSSRPSRWDPSIRKIVMTAACGRTSGGPTCWPCPCAASAPVLPDARGTVFVDDRPGRTSPTHCRRGATTSCSSAAAPRTAFGAAVPVPDTEGQHRRDVLGHDNAITYAVVASAGETDRPCGRRSTRCPVSGG